MHLMAKTHLTLTLVPLRFLLS
ncbi:hypothetical protein Patl1_23043 [Pistacia atlantica]|uniref:Uncharacterized protein n=1 Tax=Pistacia atlantica TaxID=434234 RepID=A0ACC0ZZ39_9ROSI|nr:hypothetical protein Patl1_23043 [Pistacia atlantica]